MSDKNWDDDDETNLLSHSMREVIPPTVSSYCGLATKTDFKVKLSVSNGPMNPRKTGFASKTNPTHNLNNQQSNFNNQHNQLQLTHKVSLNHVNI